MTVIPLGPTRLAVAAVLLLISGALSFALRLKMEKRLAVAAARCVLQLTVIGVVIEALFAVNRPLPVLLVLAAMVAAAAFQVPRARGRGYRGVFFVSLVSMTLAAAASGAIVLFLVVRVKPWYDPQYVIPLVGMILGNSLNGISLSLDRLLADLVSRRAEVEEALAMGATPWEAVRPLLREALAAGHVPVVNMMAIAGLVSLPGMMTGQILAGSPPLTAVAYQIVVMFMVAAAVSIGAAAFGLLTFLRIATPLSQIDFDRIG